MASTHTTSTTAQFVKRPNLGERGRPVDVFSNSLYVNAFPLQEIYHYVTVQPDCPPAINREVMVHFGTNPAVYGQTKPVYDGRKNLFSPRKLNEGTEWDGNAHSWEFAVPEADGAPSKNPRQFSVQLNLVNVIRCEELKRFCMGEGVMTNETLTAITALNVLIRHKPTIEYPSNARSFFHDAERIDLQGAIELWRGYFQSIRAAPSRMLVNVDVSAGAFIMRGNLISVCLKFLGAPNDPNILDVSRMPDRERIRLARFLKGVTIRVVHRGEEHKKMKLKIKSMSERGASSTTFQPKDGPEDNVSAYFEKTYNRPLSFPQLPTVEVRKGVMLPLEVCDVLPGQQYHAKLNADQTANALRFTTMQPNDRRASIERAVGNLQYSQNEFMSDFSLKISDQLISLKARMLEPPKLLFQNGDLQPRDGGWNMRGQQFYKSAILDSWAIVVFANPGRTENSDGIVREFVTQLISGAQENGLQINQREPLITYCGRDVRDGILNAGRQTHEKTGKLPDLVVCILPNKGAELYGIIKGLGDTDFGVPTHLQMDKVRRTNRQYVSNVLLKINAKLGGICAISDQAIQFVSSQPTMIFGVDSTHPAPGPGAHNRPTISALVGSLDRLASSYQATVRVQEGRVEVINDMRDMVYELLQRFYEQWQRLPERLLFYRDGASEGQFKEIVEKEVSAIKMACRRIGGETNRADYQPPISYVVAAKRHHIRFFPASQRDGDRSGNCPAGTVVDTTVVSPLEHDFYLQSHGGLLGTSRPAHYSVIHDENNLDADTIQSLTFALCHTYCRATRSVSIVSPCYYASLVCTRARFHLSDHFDTSDAMTSVSGGTRVTSDKEERLARFRGACPACTRILRVEVRAAAFRPVRAPAKDRIYWA